MNDYYGNRPGHLKVGGTIGPEHKKTNVFITRIASPTPGTENSKKIEFEKDVRYIVEITHPNFSESRLETTSLIDARDFIIKEAKAGYADYEVNKLTNQINWGILQ